MCNEPPPAAKVEMIFAELDYACGYDEVHDELVALLKANFATVESGHQCDSWIWVLDGEEKVAIDSFSSMKHQLKSVAAGAHVQNVISLLAGQYKLKIKSPPKSEGHESF